MSAIPKTSTVNHSQHAHAWAPAALACMGVVFGDIGTSPLYALSVAVKAAGPDGQISPHAVLGVVSLIFWSLIVVISIKYAILRSCVRTTTARAASSALLALVSPRRAKQSRWRAIHGCDRSHRGDPALWRWLHHAGNFRAERDRGHQGRRSTHGACSSPANGCDSGASILDPAQRHGFGSAAYSGRSCWPGSWWPVSSVSGNSQKSRRARRIKSVAGHHLYFGMQGRSRLL